MNILFFLREGAILIILIYFNILITSFSFILGFLIIVFISFSKWTKQIFCTANNVRNYSFLQLQFMVFRHGNKDAFDSTLVPISG
jgi:hypothetical protein